MKFAAATLLAFIAPITVGARTCFPTKLDFNNMVEPGQYITNELKSLYGVTVTAKATKGGYTPGGAARVFDSSNPGTTEDGDPDLGSPNKDCPGGGPGEGSGGHPNAKYPNCEALGNVLIIQEEDKKTPDDNVHGGVLSFTFDPPSDVDVLKILDIDEKRNPVVVTVTDREGAVSKFEPFKSGDNSVYPLAVDVKDVVTMDVFFPKSGAVAEITYQYCPPTVGASGDPHIKKWDGERYYYHGECDLVLLQNEQFGAGQGFDIHMRTKIKDFYSFIETVAMRIGETILEVTMDKIMINGDEYTEQNLPLTLEDGYTIGAPSMVAGSKAKFLIVNLKDGNYVKFTMYKQFMNVDLSGLHKDFESSAGLLGSYHDSKLLGRDGATIFDDTNSFGLEWQVQGDDRRLFQDARAPIHPQKCILPSKSASAARRGLRGKSEAETKAAEAACAHQSPSDFSYCVFDVLATGDIEMAGVW